MMSLRRGACGRGMRFSSLVTLASSSVVGATCAPIKKAPRALRFSSSDQQDRQDCPMCQKFGRGPCGDLFYAWLDCTYAAGDDATTRCASQFERFQACLEREQAYYAKEHSADDLNDAKNEKDLLHAWEELIREDLDGKERQDFPQHLKPRVIEKEQRVQVAFAPEYLVLVFVHQEKKLVTAGSKADLVPVDDEWLSLQLPSLPRDEVTISAVYEFPGNDDSDLVMYECKVSRSAFY
jgi:hypothetical protein